MAQFKVGQRVKQVATPRPEDVRPGDTVNVVGVLGDEGVVVEPHPLWNLQGAEYAVLFDHVRSSHRSGAFAMFAYQLAPLTDPAAEQFIERIKRLEREPVNATAKEKA